LGLLEKVTEYEFSISKCERCKTVIEPLISTQWFCRMDKLRDMALDLMAKTGQPKFFPAVPYEKVYTNWLEKLRDWTISRQLWWGHQIPAWYDQEGNVYVARSEEEAREQAGTKELSQDRDVLDTWFSSALWPFSTLGWPEKTKDLEVYYPTSVLVTARDIIFLWVSRMVMMGLKFMGREPFADVFVTGTILDSHGQRMSKTKMNGVDPLEVFDKYGVDATRIMLASVGTTDIRWNEKQVESYRNFANKIWNAARFCLMNSEGAEVNTGFEADRQQWRLHDRWIMSRLNKTARDVRQALDSYEFHRAVQTLYHFFWDDFCDWYIELCKYDVLTPIAGEQLLGQTSEFLSSARRRLVTVLERSLRLLHPFMPYITEEIWQKLPGVGISSLHAAYSEAEPTIMLTAYPQADEDLIDEEAEAEMQAVIELVSRVRNLRAEMNFKPSQQISIIVRTSDEKILHIFTRNSAEIGRLTNGLMPQATSPDTPIEIPKASARAVLAGGAEVAIPLEGLIDFEQEQQRLIKEREKLAVEASKLEAQLANLQFVERAPAERVAELRARISDIAQRTAQLSQSIENLR
ncbi:MAG: class I tRNA ligase family protein, partial [Pyrinomonadaceae bacterium]